MILDGVDMAYKDRMEDILLKNIATYKDRYEYYNGISEEKSEEYLSLLLLEVKSLLILKGAL